MTDRDGWCVRVKGTHAVYMPDDDDVIKFISNKNKTVILRIKGCEWINILYMNIFLARDIFYVFWNKFYEKNPEIYLPAD